MLARLAFVLLLLAAPSTPPDASGPSLSLLHARAAAVMVSTRGGSGSGWCVGHNLFATGWHVIEGKSPDSIRVVTGTQLPGVPAHVIATDPTRDLALIAASVSAPALALADAPPQVGDPVFAVGAPDGQPRLAVWGHVSDTELRRIAGGEFLVLDFGAYFGLSGSAVCNEQGKVVGTVVRWREGSHITLAVPLEHLREFLRPHIP